jgi:hypothetical protein
MYYCILFPGHARLRSSSISPAHGHGKGFKFLAFAIPISNHRKAKKKSGPDRTSERRRRARDFHVLPQEQSNHMNMSQAAS